MPVPRWKERLQNFEKALKTLEEAAGRKNPDQLEQDGTIQRFEFTFELAWKTLKDRLIYEKIDVTLPREVIKKGFQNKFIRDFDGWMEMLDYRNVTSHEYDEVKSGIVFQRIVKRFLPLLRDFLKSN
jgi:nucleotidyltransferase substrate binding protein (TIGR01987 family)